MGGGNTGQWRRGRIASAIIMERVQERPLVMRTSAQRRRTAVSEWEQWLRSASLKSPQRALNPSRGRDILLRRLAAV